jgi:hypothetical protein
MAKGMVTLNWRFIAQTPEALASRGWVGVAADFLGL